MITQNVLKRKIYRQRNKGDREHSSLLQQEVPKDKRTVG